MLHGVCEFNEAKKPLEINACFNLLNLVDLLKGTKASLCTRAQVSPVFCENGTFGCWNALMIFTIYAHISSKHVVHLSHQS